MPTSRARTSRQLSPAHPSAQFKRKQLGGATANGWRTEIFNALHGKLPQMAVFHAARDQGHGDVALDSESHRVSHITRGATWVARGK